MRWPRTFGVAEIGSSLPSCETPRGGFLQVGCPHRCVDELTRRLAGRRPASYLVPAPRTPSMGHDPWLAREMAPFSPSSILHYRHDNRPLPADWRMRMSGGGLHMAPHFAFSSLGYPRHPPRLSWIGTQVASLQFSCTALHCAALHYTALRTALRPARRRITAWSASLPT